MEKSKFSGGDICGFFQNTQIPSQIDMAKPSPISFQNIKKEPKNFSNTKSLENFTFDGTGSPIFGNYQSSVHVEENKPTLKLVPLENLQSNNFTNSSEKFTFEGTGNSVFKNCKSAVQANTSTEKLKVEQKENLYEEKFNFRSAFSTKNALNTFNNQNTKSCEICKNDVKFTDAGFVQHLLFAHFKYIYDKFNVKTSYPTHCKNCKIPLNNAVEGLDHFIDEHKILEKLYNIKKKKIENSLKKEQSIEHNKKEMLEKMKKEKMESEKLRSDTNQNELIDKIMKTQVKIILDREIVHQHICENSPNVILSRTEISDFNALNELLAKRQNLKQKIKELEEIEIERKEKKSSLFEILLKKQEQNQKAQELEEMEMVWEQLEKENEKLMEAVETVKTVNKSLKPLKASKLSNKKQRQNKKTQPKPENNKEMEEIEMVCEQLEKENKKLMEAVETVKTVNKSLKPLKTSKSKNTNKNITKVKPKVVKNKDKLKQKRKGRGKRKMTRKQKEKLQKEQQQKSDLVEIDLYSYECFMHYECFICKKRKTIPKIVKFDSIKDLRSHLAVEHFRSLISNKFVEKLKKLQMCPFPNCNSTFGSLELGESKSKFFQLLQLLKCLEIRLLFFFRFLFNLFGCLVSNL